MRRLTIRVSACTEAMGLLIEMAWADGRIDDREKEGVRGAAQVLNLPAAFRERLEEQLGTSRGLEALDVGNLTTRERAFAFVSAAWMAQVDDELDASETALLGRIGTKLEFTPEQQEEYTKIARSLQPLPDGAASWAEQLTRLFKAIPAELEEPGEAFEVVFE
jgi:tellurite resistance protein